MFRIAIFFICSALMASTLAQTNFINFTGYVNGLPSANKAAVCDSFVNYHKIRRIPIIEDNYAIFLYNNSASSATVAGDFNGWGTPLAMTRITGTNFFYYVRPFESDARIDYKLIINGTNWILDPLNPATIAGGFGPNSELAMPGFVQPWEIKSYPATQKGTVITTSLLSTNVGVTYQVKIYLPNGYNSTQQYPTVYFQDGYEYVDLASAVNVLDNLIDSNKIIPVIGVFVKPTNRNEEYAGTLRIKYQQFFTSELVPWVDANYRTIQLPEKRLVLGDSYGANISALISYNYAHLFGNCGLHSSAFQPNNYEVIDLIFKGTKKNIRYSATWGTYESVYQVMRPFRDSLQNRGYEITWQERPEGHSWGLWRATIDFILMNIFPKTLQVESNLVLKSGYRIEQNYPNPFNASTRISFSLSKPEYVIVKVYDVHGAELATLLNRDLTAGEYRVNFNANLLSSGLYFYEIQIGHNREVRKMVLLR